MKKTQICGMFALTLLLAGCGEDVMTSGKGEGKLYPVVSLDSEVLSASSRAGGDITVDDLSLRLVSEDGSFSQTWDKVSDFSTEETFKVGNYTLEAFYGADTNEGFESPYYYGAAQLTVHEDKETAVSLTASLANAMVSITFSDSFKSYMDAYNANITSSTGSNFYYGPAETRPVYVKTGSTQVSVTYTKPNGTTETVRPSAFNAEAKHLYRVNFNLTNESGKAYLTISFDDSVEQEDVIIDLSQDIATAVPPTLTAEGFENGVAQQFVEGASPESPLKMTVTARSGISSVTMKTSSRTLLQQGWPAELNLVGATAEQQTLLNALGLNVVGLWRNPDQMAVIDFTDVIEKMTFIESAATSTFEVVVTDRYGKATEPVVLSIETLKVNIAISQEAPLYYGYESLSIALDYNGANPESNVNFAYKNERGTWTEMTKTSVTENGENSYIVTLAVPANNEGITIRATYNDYISNELAVEREGSYLETSSADTFAKRTVLTVHSADGNDADAAANAIINLYKDGQPVAVTSSVNGNKIALTGLEPNTAYTANATVDGVSTINVSFTTEDAPQLENGDMETWEIVAGLTQYWWKSYVGSASGSIWGTMNLVTTSEGGSGTSMFTHNGCAYNAASGTDRTTDKANGEYAAEIRTVGWGGDNAAYGNTSGCNNITVGSLHLGSSPTSKDQAVEYGTAFNSRPDGVTFNYKYILKPSTDYGYAEAWVKDAAGNIIASGSLNLNATDTYTSATIPLTYSAGAAKAAKICVIFRSSGNPSCQTISTTNLNYPGFGNLSDGKYEGSKLYIDDITLNYN